MAVSGEVMDALAGLRRGQRYAERLVVLVLGGSQARGDPGTQVARTEFDVADASLARDTAVVCLFVSREQFEQEGSPLLTNARREGTGVRRDSQLSPLDWAKAVG